MNKGQFYEFLENQTLAVISTVYGDGAPESAVIGFGQTPNLEIVFGTNSSSRKYQNLQANPQVAFVIGWDDKQTVQYEGTARELSDDELDIVRQSYWRKNPDAERHHKTPGERYFIVTPKWLRYTDFNVYPWNVSELKF